MFISIAFVSCIDYAYVFRLHTGHVIYDLARKNAIITTKENLGRKLACPIVGPGPRVIRCTQSSSKVDRLVKNLHHEATSVQSLCEFAYVHTVD
jgi:porphobilinogen deaminase